MRDRPGAEHAGAPRRWMVPGALLLAALAVRLAFVGATPDYHPAHDDARYDRLACAIVVSGTYPASWRTATPDACGVRPSAAGQPSAFRPPGYPAFLAGVYAVSEPVTSDRWTAGRIAQAGIGVLLAGLTGALAARIWGRRVGLAALAIAAFAPPLIVVGGSLLSDLLFATLMMAAVVAALAAGRRPLLLLGVSGALAGLAALVRPQGLLLLVPLAVAAWVAAESSRRARLARLLVVVGAALAVIAPWTIRNAVRMDALVPISTHTGESLAGTYNDAARTRTDHPGAWIPPRQVPAFADVYRRPGATEVWRQRELTRRAARFALRHPGYTLEASARNSLRVANLGGRSWWRGSAGSMSLPGTAGDAAAYGSFALAALALAGAATGAARRAPAWVWLVPLLLALTTVPITGEFRMRAPIDPFLVILAAPALAYGCERLRSRPGAARW